MILYEVNLDIDAEIASEYLAWLDAHMREIRALPGFLGAELFDDAERSGAQQRSLCVQYRLGSAADLDAYLRDHAPRLRADGQARFGGRFRATRRVLERRLTL